MKGNIMRVWLLITTTVDTDCYAEGPDARSYAHATQAGAVQHLREWVEELTDDALLAGEAVTAVEADGWAEVEAGRLSISVEVKNVEVLA